jgi:hypothetical protein
MAALVPGLDTAQALRGAWPAEATGPLNDFFYAVMRDSKATRLGITSVQPFCWMRRCFLKPAKSRLTVSREVPIICPISS